MLLLFTHDIQGNLKPNADGKQTHLPELLQLNMWYLDKKNRILKRSIKVPVNL